MNPYYWALGLLGAGAAVVGVVAVVNAKQQAAAAAGSAGGAPPRLQGLNIPVLQPQDQAYYLNPNDATNTPWGGALMNPKQVSLQHGGNFVIIAPPGGMILSVEGPNLVGNRTVNASSIVFPYGQNGIGPYTIRWTLPKANGGADGLTFVTTVQMTAMSAV